MGRKTKTTISTEEVASRRMPALTPEARTNYLISLAEDLAEKQLIDGTASSAVIKHYLDLSTEKAKLERAKLENETLLLQAKRDAIESNKRQEAKLEAVLEAMKIYGGQQTGEE